MSDAMRDKIAQVIHDCDMQRDSFRDIADAIIAALPELQGWQPIETAPKDGERILGRTKFGVETVKWCDGSTADQFGPQEGWIGVEQDSGCFPASFRRPLAQSQPTHWIPLPAAPKEASHD